MQALCFYENKYCFSGVLHSCFQTRQHILPLEASLTVCFFIKDLMTLSIKNIHWGKQFYFKIGRDNYKCRIWLCLHCYNCWYNVVFWSSWTGFTKRKCRCQRLKNSEPQLPSSKVFFHFFKLLSNSVFSKLCRRHTPSTGNGNCSTSYTHWFLFAYIFTLNIA